MDIAAGYRSGSLGAVLTCEKHPEDPAGWRCGSCAAALCRRCAAWREMGQGRIVVCLRCGGAGAPIRVRRALAHPFTAGTLLEAVRWPFHKEGVLTALACAVTL